jgi:AhpD family alkylhydroperoxidase
MTTRFAIHTVDTAPTASKPALEGLKQDIGMIPNLAAAMSESPELLKGFLALRDIFYSGTFTSAEVQVLALTNAFENGCEYCMALHSAFALKAGAPKEAVEALREGRSPSEPRLKALSEYSRKLVVARGDVGEPDLSTFLAAGYTKAQALEVVLGVAVSVLPNFAHHLTRCPVDDPFSAHRWTRAR